jgi:zinc transporter 1/2/3
LAETFEGLHLGSRLAFIKLLACYNYVPMLAAIIYGLSTPVDIAVGLALRSSYNPGSATAPIVSVFDLLSADILIYTGLVEVRFFLNVVASIKLTGNTASRA